MCCVRIGLYTFGEHLWHPSSINSSIPVPSLVSRVNSGHGTTRAWSAGAFSLKHVCSLTIATPLFLPCQAPWILALQGGFPRRENWCQGQVLEEINEPLEGNFVREFARLHLNPGVPLCHCRVRLVPLLGWHPMSSLWCSRAHDTQGGGRTQPYSPLYTQH